MALKTETSRHGTAIERISLLVSAAALVAIGRTPAGGRAAEALGAWLEARGAVLPGAVSSRAAGYAVLLAAAVVAVGAAWAATSSGGRLDTNISLARGRRRAAALWVLFAAVTTGAAAYLHAHAEVILFGPPPVRAHEAYAQRRSGPVFDHSLFDSLLRRYVDADGHVDYRGLEKHAAELDRYIASLARAPFDAMGRNEKLALLINAYNAFTLRLVLDYWSGGKLKSILDIPAGKRWKAARWQVGGGHTWSLSQIEHEQIRPNFADPRVHFALVCAAAGCPRLRNEAYRADRLEEQLEDQARYVHSHKRWFRFERRRNILYLTPLYRWYASDFAQTAGGSVLRFAARYSPELRAALADGRKPAVRWLPYDWRLNRQPADGTGREAGLAHRPADSLVVGHRVGRDVQNGPRACDVDLDLLDAREAREALLDPVGAKRAGHPLHGYAYLDDVGSASRPSDPRRRDKSKHDH